MEVEFFWGWSLVFEALGSYVRASGGGGVVWTELPRGLETACVRAVLRMRVGYSKIEIMGKLWRSLQVTDWSLDVG